MAVTPHPMPDAGNPSVLETATIRQVSRRIVPFLVACYFFAFISRTNAGLAALQMNKDIGLTPAPVGRVAGSRRPRRPAWLAVDVPAGRPPDRAAGRDGFFPPARQPRDRTVAPA